MKIGLEVHVALQTDTKLFCRCRNDAAEVNTAICPTCMGFPGSKPVLNGSALSIALGIAKALNCKTREKISFIRKVYFYPDLPKSYQITQLDEPMGYDGWVEYGKRKVGIRRVQLEEDPARIIREEEYTLIDFNRSGVPLVEIVTEPEIVDPEDLRSFLFELESILYYLGIDIEKELKIDLNISLGRNRVEVKNVTGIRNLVDAARHEMERQKALLDSGKDVVAETRSYNEGKGVTEESREKESDEEYGYIYDPDLTEYSLTGVEFAKPLMAGKIAHEYAERYVANEDTLRELLMFNRDALRLLEYAKDRRSMKSIINAISLLRKYNGMEMDEDSFDQMAMLLEKGGYVGEETVKKLLSGGSIDINVEEVKVEDLDREILELINKNEGLFEEYEKNPKTFNFIVGEMMKKHKLNPRYIAERLGKLLEERRK